MNTIDMDEEKIFERLLNELFPDNLNCIVCDMPVSRTNKYSICKECMEKLYFIRTRCEKCGKPTINVSINRKQSKVGCGYCKDKNFLFDRKISVLEYDENSSKLVFGLKYSNKTFLPTHIAKFMYDMLRKNRAINFYDYDFMTYVPLSKERMESRGFNQSELLAEDMGMIANIPVINTVNRVKDTKRLFGLDSYERKRELNSAFEIDEYFSRYCKGNRIIVVDDIFTTGSTVNEISKVLKLAGVKEVVSLTLLTGGFVEKIDE